MQMQLLERTKPAYCFGKFPDFRVTQIKRLQRMKVCYRLGYRSWGSPFSVLSQTIVLSFVSTTMIDLPSLSSMTTR
ncbi:MAG TPA: hypothetical protein VKM55_21995, partial [Candidatus Lokiarchaeia archaeon]|nr:hypothetical protein [Candidatus Lokiarchaeia archaeon]